MPTTENNTISTEQNEISLKDLIVKLSSFYKYLLTKWIIIVPFGLLGCVLGYLYAKSKTPIYTATTTFVLENEKNSNGLGSLAGLASIAGFDIGSAGGGIFQGDNILDLYKSKSMIRKTLLTEVSFNGKKELLIDHYVNFNGLKEKWNEKGLKNIDFHVQPGKEFSRAQDSLLIEIGEDINANYLFVTKPDKKLSIVQTDVKSEDEWFAKVFNDEIVKNVNDFYIQTKTKKSLENIKILQQKTDSVRSVMNGAIYSAAAVNDATPNLNPTRQTQRVVPLQRSQFSAETNKAILGTLLQNLEVSKMSLLKETPLIQVIDEPIFPLKKEKLGKAKGVLLGGFFFGFVVVFFFTAKKALKTVMK